MISFIIAAMASASVSLNGGGFLVVVNQFQHSISAVDPSNGKVLGTVSVGVNGHEVAVPKQGKLAYVPIYSNVAVGQTGTNGNHIDVVDLHDFKVVRHIDLGKDVRPHCAEFAPDGTLYVSAELDEALYSVDMNGINRVGRIPTGQPETHMFVISKNGRRAFTSNISAGTVSVVDLKTQKLDAIIPVANSIQRISISSDGRTVFTHDQGKPRIAIIDTETFRVTGWIDVPTVVFASTTTPDGRWLLAISPGGHSLYAIDLADHSLKHTVDLPGSPMEAIVSPDGAKAYISCIGSGQIASLDLKSWTLGSPIQLLPGVDGLAWATH